MKEDEGLIHVPGGRVWYRSVGEQKNDRAPLLVGGRYDECTPAHLAAMHQRIRGYQFRIIEDASHLCFAEQPAEFEEIVNSFFDLTDRGSGL